jgi:hypothetical protein
MPEDTTQDTAVAPRTRKTPKHTVHIVETKEPAFSVSPRNPQGDILTIRQPLLVYLDADGQIDVTRTIDTTWEMFKAAVAKVVANVWQDDHAIYLGSFDFAVAGAMASGASLEDAFGVTEATEQQQHAFKRLAPSGGRGGATNRGGSGRGGSSRGGGGGERKPPLDLDVVSDSVYDALPKAFKDELDGGVRCPSCGGTKFWDNRENSTAKGPKLACANKGCEGGGERNDGGYWPWAWFGSQSGGGRARSSRSD